MPTDAILGFVAGCLASSALVPQLVHMLRSPAAAREIRWAMLALSASGNALWVAHGALHRDPMIVLFCAVGVAVTGGMAAIKAARRGGGAAAASSPRHALQRVEVVPQHASACDTDDDAPPSQHLLPEGEPVSTAAAAGGGTTLVQRAPSCSLPS
jgi:uncharacterized protein with PQ loop repeat